MTEKTPLSETPSLYSALNENAQQALEIRDYTSAPLNEKLASSGVEVSQLVNLNDAAEKPENWIPGVEFIGRRVFRQRHRGFFGEMARLNEGVLQKVGLKPQQWASATMYSGTAKGFHIHPPHIPDGYSAEQWFQRLFVENPDAYEDRPYDLEQWDVMFFVRGNVEMFLVDERAGMPRRKMRFVIDGDDSPGPNNAAVVIPAGVAHALRCESSDDLIMVYGTSTSFNPDFEGRIASGIEKAEVHDDWARYFVD